ncbi:hypothetical protein GCM10027273_44640 [Nocardioides pakistanensis]
MIMGVHIDTSEVLALTASIETNAGRLGARVSTALRKTAIDIEADAKHLAPVDTGTLMNSISTTITGDGRHGSMVAEIGPTAEYGGYVEGGTSVMAPQPYMGPAFDRRAPLFEAAVARIGADIL